MAHDLFDFLFGGTDTSALDAQVLSNQRAQELIREQANLARADVLSIFDPAQQASQQGFQAAANLFGESIPEQARLFSLGNVEAQRAQTQGLAGFRESILGLPQNFSQDFLQQEIQQFTPSFGFGAQGIPIPTAPSISSLGLSGTGLPEIPSFFTGTTPGLSSGGLTGGEGLQEPILTTDQTQQGITEIGPLVNQLLSQTELPLLDRANVVFDEASRLGLSVQQLAENSVLTVEEILIGLEQTGRTLPGAPFRPPSTTPVPIFQGTQNQDPEFLASQRLAGGGF